MGMRACLARAASYRLEQTEFHFQVAKSRRSRRVLPGLTFCARKLNAMATTPRKLGRPSKGPREELKCRVPVGLKRDTAAVASEYGMTTQDWLEALVAAAVRDRVDPRHQEVLFPRSA
jgi:hypothetical protein